MENTSLSIYAPETFATIKEVATALSNSDLVPAHFQKKPANVLLALEFAHRNNIAPFAAMQSMFVISGKVGMSAAMAISLARKANVWKSLTYKVSGQGADMVVTAVAKLHDDSEVDTTVTMKMAIDAGWTRNPIYKALPELMLKYRAATFLIRTHFPECLSGMQTAEENEDVIASKTNAPSVIDVSPVIVAPQIEAPKPVVVEDKKAPRKAVEKPQKTAPEVAVVEADQAEMNYLYQLCDKFLPKAQDPDVAETIKTIRSSKIRAGAVRVLHVPMLAAVEGKGLADLDAWASSAIIKNTQSAHEGIPAEQVPF